MDNSRRVGRGYELRVTQEGAVSVRVHLRGSGVLGSPTINRGTAFTLPEREALGLTGLLPTGVSTLEGQLRAGVCAVQGAGN